ncbi:diguanylate cyclase [Jiella sp. M17.18]|uniref:diguanylate cyclase domain-containing protein n=1 Tax=Jiella sp. M17.18 TaxID=3234247 RepID=UPI0034DEE41A
MFMQRLQHDAGTEPLSHQTEQEMATLLTKNRAAVVAVTLAQAAVAVPAAVQAGGGLLVVLAVLGPVVGLGRLATLSAPMQARALRDPRWGEQVYAAGSFVFAAIVGITSALILLQPDSSAQIVGVALVYAYCAGVVARLSVRPWICKGSLLLANLPFALALATQWEPAYVGVVLLSVIMLAGSLETIHHVHGYVGRGLELQRRLSDLARRDRLTQLPNRLALESHLREALQRRAPGEVVAVHFLDLDHFKEANDQFGHGAGDDVLRIVGERLLGLVRMSDVVARFGGDEFVVLQPRLTDRSEAERLAARIVRSLEEPIAVGGRVIRIGTTVGIAFAPDDANDPGTLVDKADAALYAAKRSHRGSIGFAGTAVLAAAE